MTDKIQIEGFNISYFPFQESKKLIYMIYPDMVTFTDEWQEKMANQYKVSIAVIYIPSSQWNDLLTPWPEPGEAKGFPPFAGKAESFLATLQSKIIPTVESRIRFTNNFERDLLGVSLSGLFTLWQWLQCSFFKSIASLSGSFWYNGFIEWFDSQKIQYKTGKAFFLLGKQEPKAPVKAYQSVGINTESIVERLKQTGIDVEFEWVAGDHFANPIPRAELAIGFLAS